MLNLLFLFLIAVPVGFVGSLVGIGGASILVPILVSLGYPVKEAIATGMVTVIATSAGSAVTFVSEKITNVRVAMFLEIFTVTGAIIGATLTTIIAPAYLYFFFAAFLAASLLDPKKIREASSRLPFAGHGRLSRWLGLSGAYFDESLGKTVEYRVSNVLVGGIGMFGAGISAGMLGIGAGAFKVSIQEKIMRMPTKVSSATSNFIIGMTALAGATVYLSAGLINTTVTAPLVVGTTIGSFFGGRLLGRTADRTLTVVFVLIVITLIAQMLYKGVTFL
jgi:uncharacterized membrane protein YfcA